MPRPPFVEEQYYHIYNRGVDKREVFMDDEDRYRFLHDLYEFNDRNFTPPFIRRAPKGTGKELVGSSTPYSKSREILIEILCFVLMPNHWHLILKQIGERGIPIFMQKMGTGYTNYFNNKYERTGALFQGRFKAKHIDNDTYLTHLTKYIHLNPVDLCQPEWEKTGLGNPEMAKNFLLNYKWSSFKDYIGEKNYPSLINSNLIMNMLGNETGYKKFIFNDLSGDFGRIKDYMID